MFIMLRVPPRRPSRKKTLLMTRTTTLSFARSPRTVGFLYAIGRARSSSTFASTTSRMASKCLARKESHLPWISGKFFEITSRQLTRRLRRIDRKE
ncbi:hypothetical protein CsatB_023198 [Cannabis sativa]